MPMESTPVISSAPRPDCWRIAPTKSSEMIPLEALIVRIIGAAAVWPFVKIYYRRDKHADPKPIGDAVHEALVAQANVPRDDRFHVFLPLDDIVADPAYGGVQRSDRLVIVEITLNAGRTVEIKKSLYA